MVEVRDSRGHPATEVELTVIEESTTRAQTTRTDSLGMARVCDLGLSPVTLRVGKQGCYQVTVTRAVLPFGNNRLSVIYDRGRDPCTLDPPAPSGCAYLLRILDEKKRAVPNARVQGRFVGPKTAITDSFGRALVVIRNGTTERIRIEAEGFLSHAEAFECSSEPLNEKPIQLVRR